MSIMTYISLPIFFASFIVGLFCIFFWGPETKTVQMYPSPDNYKDFTFTYDDNTNQCFRLFPEKVDCPSDVHLIE